MAQQLWVKTDTKIAGPFSSSQIRELATCGKLKPDSQLSEDKNNWVAVHSVNGLVFPANSMPPEKPEALEIADGQLLGPETSSLADFFDENLPDQASEFLNQSGATSLGLPTQHLPKTELPSQRTGAASRHVDVKPILFGVRTRYEITKSPFGSLILTVQRYIGKRKTGACRKLNLRDFEILHVVQGSTVGSYLLQLLVCVVVLALGLGICGLFIIFFLGLWPHWRSPAVSFARGEEDAFDDEKAFFQFPNKRSLREFCSMIKASTNLHTRRH
ncbi:MAG: hypothetical protein O3C40_20935 [Planctomycetota bacterium]|nr:hypothetical protein [Planctomycetota bacterium]